MLHNKLLNVVSLLIVIGLILASCAAPTEAPTQPSVTEPPATQEPVVVEPTATEPTVVEPTTESPTVDIPKQVQFCSMYTTSITENGWDRSGYESFLRFAKNPGMDIEVKELKFTEGLYGDEADAAMRAFAESGCDIIWGHGGYNDIVIPISKA